MPQNNEPQTTTPLPRTATPGADPRRQRLTGWPVWVVRWLAVGTIVSSHLAFASSNVCLYNGKKHDDRYGKIQNFTGEMTCTDSETKKLVLRERWVNGQRDGAYTKFASTTGKVEESGSYRRGKLHGVLKRYNDSGQYLESSYEDGQPVGVQKELRGGVVSRLFLAGSEPMVEIYFNTKGQLTDVHCGAQFIGKDDFEWCGHNGKQSTVKLFDDKGRLSATKQYLWGKEHGASKQFNVKTGEVIRESKYVQGLEQKDGRRAYDRDGALLVKTDCDDSRKSCKETQFYSGGKDIKTVTVWKNGQEAKHTDYFQNGKPRQDREAVNGKFKIIEYLDTGEIHTRGTYIRSSGWYWKSYVPDGLVETFWEAGKHWRKENFRGGQLQGRSEYFWKKNADQLRAELEFKDDVRVHEKLFLNGKLVEESEYAPDGSLKNKKQYSPNPIDWEI